MMTFRLKTKVISDISDRFDLSMFANELLNVTGWM